MEHITGKKAHKRRKTTAGRAPETRWMPTSASSQSRQWGNAICQAKLKISTPDDPLEREADQVADQVMRMPADTIQRRS
jgi:hypothetical protein